MRSKFSYLLTSYLYYNKITFIRKMKGGKVLDLGCGNHSPSITKYINPAIFYVGTDIDRYNIDDKDINAANEMYFFNVEVFFDEIIEKINYEFNYIICTHTIEHLPDKDLLFRTLKAKLAKGGVCYLTTPNIHSINFPSSRGCLNYYDDQTHINMPLTFQNIYDLCIRHDLRLTKFKQQNTSVIGYLIGLLFEPFRVIFKRNMLFTWLFWGFEDLYIIEKV